MRRAIVAIGGTAAGLAALLAFKTHPIGDLSANVTTGSTPSATLGTGPGGAHGTGTATTPSPMATAKKRMMTRAPASGMSQGTRTLTGSVASTSYGPMQVQVVLDGTRITKVNVLQQTDSGAESSQIDANAIPQLTSETLTVQSARIDTVSGATATSQGYIQSLQSALDKA